MDTRRDTRAGPGWGHLPAPAPARGIRPRVSGQPRVAGRTAIREVGGRRALRRPLPSDLGARPLGGAPVDLAPLAGARPGPIPWSRTRLDARPLPGDRGRPELAGARKGSAWIAGRHGGGPRGRTRPLRPVSDEGGRGPPGPSRLRHD